MNGRQRMGGSHLPMNLEFAIEKYVVVFNLHASSSTPSYSFNA